MTICKTAICAGTFDPPTIGHINIIERGLKIFEKIIIAVAVNTRKQPIFNQTERVELLREIFKDQKRVEVDSFDGLLVEYARKRNVTTILRGIRNMGDYEYESQMALANKTLFPELEIIYMLTEGKYAHLSSSVIKEIITFGGSGKNMIHPAVEEKMKLKFKKEASK